MFLLNQRQNLHVCLVVENDISFDTLTLSPFGFRTDGDLSGLRNLVVIFLLCLRKIHVWLEKDMCIVNISSCCGISYAVCNCNFPVLHTSAQTAAVLHAQSLTRREERSQTAMTMMLIGPSLTVRRMNPAN